MVSESKRDELKRSLKELSRDIKDIKRTLSAMRKRRSSVKRQFREELFRGQFLLLSKEITRGIISKQELHRQFPENLFFISRLTELNRRLAFFGHQGITLPWAIEMPTDHLKKVWLLLIRLLLIVSYAILRGLEVLQGLMRPRLELEIKAVALPLIINPQIQPNAPDLAG
jgi:hypothetical protein